jgi:hypothetical protein
MNNNPSLIITSIAAPNSVLENYAKLCAQKNMNFILIGDVPSPVDFHIEGCRFYGIGDQKKLPFSIIERLPERHYSRKNIGYLLAAKSKWIVETDDDNLPLDSFWDDRVKNIRARVPAEKGWTNVYRYFSGANIWPRGFPLDLIQQPLQSLADVHEFNCPIQQGLANENPDVDAIYRMVSELPLNFGDHEPVALPAGNWCPFNSQNTTWFPEAYLLLYLPSYCSFRMTDIWRSFVAQRIAWTCNWPVLFHKATVWQERNVHNLMKDFADEIPGYLHNSAIVRALEALTLDNGAAHIGANLIRCYEALIDMGVVGAEELPLVKAWVTDMQLAMNEA